MTSAISSTIVVARRRRRCRRPSRCSAATRRAGCAGSPARAIAGLAAGCTARRSAAGEGPQEGALAGLRVAEDDQVRVAGQVQVHRGQVVLGDADRRCPRLGSASRLLVLDQWPAAAGRRGARGPGHRPRRPGRPARPDAVGEVVGGLLAVDPRQRGEHVQLAGREAAAGRAGRHVDAVRRSIIESRGVAEPQLQPGAEQVPDGGPQVHPARRPRPPRGCRRTGPRVARSVTCGSRSSNSLRMVHQPSTTRNTSPYGSSVTCPVRSPRR